MLVRYQQVNCQSREGQEAHARDDAACSRVLKRAVHCFVEFGMVAACDAGRCGFGRDVHSALGVTQTTLVRLDRSSGRSEGICRHGAVEARNSAHQRHLHRVL